MSEFMGLIYGNYEAKVKKDFFFPVKKKKKEQKNLNV